MLARLRASQRDVRRRQADDCGNFQRVGENCGLTLAVSGPKFMKIWNDIGNLS